MTSDCRDLRWIPLLKGDGALASHFGQDLHRLARCTGNTWRLSADGQPQGVQVKGKPMHGSQSARRSVAVVLATALASVGGIATAGSAFAADQLQININPYQLAVPAVVNGVSVTKTLQVAIYHDQREEVGTAKVTINASALSKVAQVTWPTGCTHVGDVGTCAKTYINPISPGWKYLTLGLKALPGVRSARGTIEVTASTPDMAGATDSAPVSVAVGTDLVASLLPTLNRVKVGSTVQAPISWTNTGDETAPRTHVTLQTMPGLAFKQRLKNCAYTANGLTAVCTVNTPLKPGQTLRFPVALTVTKEAWYAIMGVDVAPLGAGTAKPPADLNSNNDSFAELDVHALNTAHFAAIGAAVHGTAGQTIPVTIGMQSEGPAYIYDRSGGEEVGDVDVEFPAGTTVTTTPQDCFYSPAAAKYPAHYYCWLPADVAPGQRFLDTFSLRVDKVVTDARGKVWLDNAIINDTGRPAGYPWDPSSAGHTTTLVLNP